MPNHREQLQAIRTFPQLIKYLRDELDWPISRDNFEDISFPYTPEELGIDLKVAVKIQEIRRLRPLTANQPWGIFFIKFEPKRLPVVALRRMLKAVALKKRATADSAERLTWDTEDLLFISNYGEEDSRQITFAQFTLNEEKKDLPTLKVLGWDNKDTALHLDHVAESLATYLTWPDDLNDTSAWRSSWRSAFTIGHREVIDTAKKLSVHLAHLARNIRERINGVLDYETENGPITKLMNAFKEALVHDLDNDGFADMYAQTIAYGLLSARIANPSGKTADDFASAVPVTNPFLKELMETFIDVGGRGNRKKAIRLDFDELGVSEVVELLDEANMEAVVRDFGDKNPLEDPVTHFYEQFFADYDNSERYKRGVFYTPRPVVSFIVRSVNQLLQEEFGLLDGLADTTTWGEMADRIQDLKIPEGVDPGQTFVQILDPATGTGTFLVEVIHIIHDTMITKWRADGKSDQEVVGLWNQYVPEDLLPRLHGYELMMAPYAIAHLKIGLKLYETGYAFGTDERARVYLTNALEPKQDFSGTLAFAIPALAHESEAVNKVKREQTFTIVIGNPPYAGHSSNNGAWIENLVDDYFRIEGKHINEANSKWLRDDYVKFIRLGQSMIQHASAGVFSFITNHGYIDNPTFRAMRHSLITAFDGITIADLHGNMKKREVDAEGNPDANVFDIQQGVAIFVNRKLGNRQEPWIRHVHIRGTRTQKYHLLGNEHIGVLALNPVDPSPPFFLLAPQDVSTREEYNAFPNLAESVGQSSLGILTKRDSLAVAFNIDQLNKQLSRFVDPDVDDEDVAVEFGVPLADKDKWSLSSARKELRQLDSSKFRYLLYRPFDLRVVYYDDILVARTNRRVLGHLTRLEKNKAIILGRQGMATGSQLWDVCFMSSGLSDQNIYRRGGGTVFPLFLSEDGDSLLPGDMYVNIKQAFIEHFGDMVLTPSQLFDYIYGILHSLDYRIRYSEFLKMDFPHIPVPTDAVLFQSISEFGRELSDLHIMCSPLLNSPITSLVGSTAFQVEKVSFTDETVWIDKAITQGFRGVSEEVWNFHIGGYKVCEKWLKDRQAKGGKNPRPGRVLAQEDIEHYQKIIVAISETIRIMGEIDEVIEAHGGWPGAFQVNE